MDRKVTMENPEMVGQSSPGNLRHKINNTDDHEMSPIGNFSPITGGDSRSPKKGLDLVMTKLSSGEKRIMRESS